MAVAPTFRMIDLAGQRFGRLTVVERTPTHVKGKIKWLCKCDCGETRENFTQALRHGVVKSCGCLKREMATTNGESVSRKVSPEYRAWQDMMQRTDNPKNKHYGDYGGRGIETCERWAEFDNFLADMGRRPSAKYSIDRIDNNQGYSPSNCRWATRAEQNRNRRDNRLITYKGETKCIMDWAVEKGLKWSTLGGRLRRGEPIESALNRPLKMCGRRVTNLRKAANAAV
jgi:hypothetical protein